MKAASTDAAYRTLHPLLQALEARRVAREVLAFIFHNCRLRMARVSWRLARARLDGVEGGGRGRRALRHRRATRTLNAYHLLELRELRIVDLPPLLLLNILLHEPRLAPKNVHPFRLI